MKPLSDIQTDIMSILYEFRHEFHGLTPNVIGHRCGFRAGQAKTGRSGRGHGSRVMGVAVHITPGLTGLRKRGLVDFGLREDGMSGTSYYITDEGVEFWEDILKGSA